MYSSDIYFILRVRIIFAGDDTTDEDAINALKGMAMTFRIVSNHVRILYKSVSLYYMLNLLQICRITYTS